MASHHDESPSAAAPTRRSLVGRDDLFGEPQHKVKHQSGIATTRGEADEYERQGLLAAASSRRRKHSATSSTSTPQSEEDDDDKVEEEEEVPVHSLRVFGMCCGGCIIEWSWAVEDSALLPLMLRRGIPSHLGALIYLPVSLVSFAIAPFVGRASDRCESRLGRRRPFIIGLSLLIIVGLSAMLFEPQLAAWMEPLMGATSAAMCVYFVLAVVSDSGTCLLLGPTRALVGDLLPPKQLEVVNAQYGAYLVLARAAALAVGSLPLDKAAAALGFHWVQEEVLICVATCFIGLCALISCIAGKEKPYVRCGELSPTADAKANKTFEAENESMWKKLKKVPSRVVVLLIMQLCAMTVVIAQAWFWTVYISPDVVFEGTNIHVTFIGLCGQSVVAFILGTLMPRMGALLGHMMTFMTMMSLFCVLLCLTYLDLSYAVVVVMVSIMGCGFSVTDGTMYVMMEEETADCAETDRGFYMSLLAGSITIAVCIVSPASALVLWLMDGEIAFMFLSSGIFGLVSLWLLWAIDVWMLRRRAATAQNQSKSLEIDHILSSP